MEGRLKSKVGSLNRNLTSELQIENLPTVSPTLRSDGLPTLDYHHQGRVTPANPLTHLTLFPPATENHHEDRPNPPVQRSRLGEAFLELIPALTLFSDRSMMS